MRKYFMLTITLFVLLGYVLPCRAASFYSSSQYVNSVARYIAGNKAKIGGGTFMALNEKEQRKRGGKTLFQGTAVTPDDMLRAYYDPAKLSYLAHAVMRVMSNTDKANYVYYQRRLAEFQAAVDSAVNVGRYNIPKDVKMLDLTFAEGALITSAATAGSVILPSQSEWKRWVSGDTASLVRLLEVHEKNGVIILVDRWTPAAIRNCIGQYKYQITMPAVNEGDYFNSLNSVYRYMGKRIENLKKQPNGDKKK